MPNSNVLVSICCITYNHEKYIRDAIEGFLIQKTTFPFEIIIHDDASTDNTQKIIREYSNKENRIVSILRKTNIKSTGVPVFPFTFQKAKGKYIALCEGDDYWTDSLKLQKQVDFLEANLEFSLCFHNAKVIYEDKKKQPHSFVHLEKTTFNIVDIIISPWFIPTQSILFRREYLVFPEWFKYVYNGDLALQLIYALKGNFYYLDEIMSVYRKHGTSAGATHSNSFIKLKIIEALTYFNQYTHFEYNSSIQKKINILRTELYKTLLYERHIINRLLSLDFYLFKFKSLLKKLS